jgi:hypothetical protein
MPNMEQSNAWRNSTGGDGDPSHNAIVKPYLDPSHGRNGLRTANYAGAVSDYAINPWLTDRNAGNYGLADGARPMKATMVAVRQYVIDGDGAKVYSVWFIPPEESAPR